MSERLMEDETYVCAVCERTDNETVSDSDLQ